MNSLFSLNGKVALVTGASRGLGQGISVGLAKAGAEVIGVGTRTLQSTKESVESVGGTFHELISDLSENGAAEKLAADAIAITGRVDILVNNAGIYSSSTVEETSIEEWKKMFTVNVEGVFLGTKSVLEEMKKSSLDNDSGSIVNL